MTKFTVILDWELIGLGFLYSGSIHNIQPYACAHMTWQIVGHGLEDNRLHLGIILCNHNVVHYPSESFQMLI